MGGEDFTGIYMLCSFKAFKKKTALIIAFSSLVDGLLDMHMGIDINCDVNNPF